MNGSFQMSQFKEEAFHKTECKIEGKRKKKPTRFHQKRDKLTSNVEKEDSVQRAKNIEKYKMRIEELSILLIEKKKNEEQVKSHQQNDTDRRCRSVDENMFFDRIYAENPTLRNVLIKYGLLTTSLQDSFNKQRQNENCVEQNAKKNAKKTIKKEKVAGSKTNSSSDATESIKNITVLTNIEELPVNTGKINDMQHRTMVNKNFHKKENEQNFVDETRSDNKKYNDNKFFTDKNSVNEKYHDKNFVNEMYNDNNFVNMEILNDNNFVNHKNNDNNFVQDINFVNEKHTDNNFDNETNSVRLNKTKKKEDEKKKNSTNIFNKTINAERLNYIYGNYSKARERVTDPKPRCITVASYDCNVQKTPEIKNQEKENTLLNSHYTASKYGIENTYTVQEKSNSVSNYTETNISENGLTKRRLHKSISSPALFLTTPINEKNLHPNNTNCFDCNKTFTEDSPRAEDNGNLCIKCMKQRQTRKEAIIELMETEINYGNDLRILKNEFYAPLKTNAVCTSSELNKIFTNLTEILAVNKQLCHCFDEELQLCKSRSDHYFRYFNIGEIFLNNIDLFEAYETFCAQRKQALETLNYMENKSNLFRVFLQESCRENTKLRKMDLKSFLAMPTQRIMKYPLLLQIIYKNTVRSSFDRDNIHLAVTKIKEQIKQINDTTEPYSKLKPVTSHIFFNSLDVKKVKKILNQFIKWNEEQTNIVFENNNFEMRTQKNYMFNSNFIKKKCQVRIYACVHTSDTKLELTHNYATKEAALVIFKRDCSNRWRLYNKPVDLKHAIIIFNARAPNKISISTIEKNVLLLANRNVSEVKEIKSKLDDIIGNLDAKWSQRRNAMSNIIIRTVQ